MERGDSTSVELSRLRDDFAAFAKLLKSQVIGNRVRMQVAGTLRVGVIADVDDYGDPVMIPDGCDDETVSCNWRDLSPEGGAG